jgi:hypothetical protein
MKSPDAPWYATQCKPSKSMAHVIDSRPRPSLGKIPSAFLPSISRLQQFRTLDYGNTPGVVQVYRNAPPGQALNSPPHPPPDPLPLFLCSNRAALIRSPQTDSRSLPNPSSASTDFLHSTPVVSSRSVRLDRSP